jgi:hypothetical protein
LPPEEELELEEDDDDEDDDEDPQAARIAPSSGADIPIMLPRRMKSRRLTWPATNSSM